MEGVDRGVKHVGQDLQGEQRCEKWLTWCPPRNGHVTSRTQNPALTCRISLLDEAPPVARTLEPAADQDDLIIVINNIVTTVNSIQRVTKSLIT